MADELIPTISTQSAFNAVSGVSSFVVDLIMYIAIFAVFALIYYIIWRIKAYNYEVILRERIQGNRSRIFRTKGRIKYKKKEPYRFILQNNRFGHLNAEIPPDACVDIKSNGKLFVEGFIVEKNQIVWGKDKQDDINILDPYTQTQRAMLIMQDMKALQEEGFQWEKYIMPIASMIFVVVLLATAMLFWDNITEPSVKALQTTDSILSKLNPLLDRIIELNSSIQNVGNKPIQGVTQYGG